MSAEQNLVIATWFLGFATLLVVVVAIFQDKIRSWLTRPKLNVSLKVTPPDCHKTIMRRSDKEGNVITEAECYYFRIRVNNEGNEKAESVEVLVEMLSRQQADGKFKPVESFLPMNLKWSIYSVIYFEAISPGTYKLCDLGHIIDPTLRENFADGENLDGIEKDKTILSLDTAARPFTKSYLIQPGKYRITLLVAAANTRPIKKILEITLPGEWHNDEREMLGQGIGITMIN